MKDLYLIFGLLEYSPIFGTQKYWENLFIWQFNWGGFLLKSNGGVQRYAKNWMETNRYITREKIYLHRLIYLISVMAKACFTVRPTSQAVT